MLLPWLQLLRDPNFQWVLSGTVLLGISNGVLGSFALLRKRSLMGDVLAHTALPGVCVAFLLTQSKSVIPLLIGAIIAGLIGTMCLNFITRHSRIKEDSALGIVLTVGFGLGIVLLTFISKTGAANQSGLDRFLFGQAASLVAADVRVMAIIATVLIVAIVFFYKEFKLVCFDRQFGLTVGYPMHALDNMLMLLVVVAVAIGLQAVGVVLMAALLITPAVSARYWTDRLGRMVFFAGIFGGMSGLAGTVLSTLGPRLATGPLIVLMATCFFVISLLFAPRRGIVPQWLHRMRMRETVARDLLLRRMFEIFEAADTVSVTGVRTDAMAPGQSGSDVLQRRLHALEIEGLIRRVGGDGFTLTPAGCTAAYKAVRRHRLSEMMLMYGDRLGIGKLGGLEADIEKQVEPAVLAQLDHLLTSHGRQPDVEAVSSRVALNGGEPA